MLKDGEYEHDYDVEFYADHTERKQDYIWISFHFSPDNNSYDIKDYTKKSGRERPEYENTKASVILAIMSSCVSLNNLEVTI